MLTGNREKAVWVPRGYAESSFVSMIQEDYMNGFLRLREFRERYISGEFADSSFATMVQAGWYDWFCQDSELAGRLKRLWDVIVSRITYDRVLDAYTIHFCNVCPASDHPLFDRIYPNRFDSDYCLSVDIDDKRNAHRFEVNTSESTAFSSDSTDETLSFIGKELKDHLQAVHKVRATRAQVYKPFYSAVPEFNALDGTNGGISGKESSVFVEDPHGQDLIAEDDPRLMRIVPDAGGAEDSTWNLSTATRVKGIRTGWTAGILPK